MIEKINKILEKLPEEYRDSIREIVEIIIKEEIEQNRRMIQELWDIIREGNRAHNERFDRLEKALIELTKVSKEQGEKIDILEKALIELTERVNVLAQAVSELREVSKEHSEKIIELTHAVNELRQAIKESNQRMDRMEQRMNEEFQRIWQAIESLTKSVNELREITKEHGERIEKLEKAVMELTQAVSELRQAVNELRQITKEQGERIDRLEKALIELTERINNLTKAFERSEKVNKQTRKKLETLSDNFGYLLEDRAIRYLPKLLKEKYNIRIIEPLKRGYIKLGKKYIEVNIYGKGKRDDEEFIIIGEAKTRLSQKEVNKFIEKCNEIGGRQFRILISYLIPPQLENILLNNNIEFINSYELEI